MLSATAQKAIEFYGGISLWENATTIEAEVSVTGLAFVLKRRPYFTHAHLWLDVQKPNAKITPIGRKQDVTGLFQEVEVQLISSSGAILEQRGKPRSYFPFGRRLFYWDDLDMAYFANYAFWNYFTLPHLLLNPTIEWTEKANGILHAVFPNDFPTHNKMQEFYFDSDGRLLYHHYTVDIISKLARVVNTVAEHSNNGMIQFPSRRIITPRSSSGKALSGPVMIDIQVHRFRVNGI